MKALIPLLAVVSIGCASVAKRMVALDIGMSKEEVLKIMGEPDLKYGQGGNEVLEYRHDRFMEPLEQYFVVIAEGKVEKYGHADYVYPPTQEELNRRAQMRAAAMQMMMMQGPPRMSAPAQRPIYRPARPVQTNCTTRMSGGVAYSDCSSQPTGLDTSIYGN